MYIKAKHIKVKKKWNKNLAKLLLQWMHLLSKYENIKDYPYHVFMYNLFAIVPLLEVLDANGYHETRTVKAHRLGKSCPLAAHC